MAEYAANSPDIKRHIQELQYAKLRGGQECERSAGRNSNNCWCMGLGLKGVALPCPVEGGELPAATAAIPL